LDFRPLGALLVRPDANGNIGVFDTAGNENLTFIGGKFGGRVINGNTATSSPISSTISTVDVHSGTVVQFTPQGFNGSTIEYSVIVSNNTANDGVSLSLYSKVGAQSPVGGVAVDGTWNGLIGGPVFDFATSITANQPITFIRFISTNGAGIGNVITYSLAFAAITGGTASFNIREFQVKGF
jgi:hypothetical protein